MLLGDGFGGFGGIAKFNRDFLRALSDVSFVTSLRALPRTISESLEPDMPAQLIYETQAARGKIAFAWRVLACLLRGDRIDVVVCGHIHLLPAAWLLARLRRARLVLVIHGFEAWQAKSWVRSLLAGQIDDLIAVSRTSAARFCGWSGFALERATILPNCVDLARFHPQPKDEALMRRYGLGAGPVIMTVGRIMAHERYKGFDEVIDVMPRLLKRHPGLHYVIVGDGNDRTRLEDKVKRAGLGDAVLFTGRIAEADKVATYNLADAYVMPGTGEGFGIVLIEALACGLPVVGSSVDGSRDALLGGALGRLVDPAASDALTDAILAALAQGRGAPPARLVEFSEDRFKDRVSAWASALCRN